MSDVYVFSFVPNARLTQNQTAKLTLRFTSTSFWRTQASVRTSTRLRSCSPLDLESMVEAEEEEEAATDGGCPDVVEAKKSVREEGDAADAPPSRWAKARSGWWWG